MSANTDAAAYSGGTIGPVEITTDGRTWTATITLGTRTVRVRFDRAPDEDEEYAEDIARAMWRDIPWRFELVPETAEMECE